MSVPALMLRFLLASALLLGGCAPGASGEHVFLGPDDSRTKQAFGLVDLINGGDGAAVEAYARAHFADHFLASSPMEHHVEAFVSLHRRFAPLRVDSMAARSPEEVVVYLRSAHDQRLELLLGIAPETPGRVEGLQVVPVGEQQPAHEAAAPGARGVADALSEALRTAEGEGFSGVALVRRGDVVLLHEGVGLAHRATGTRWSPSSVFDMGSVSKSFTAAAILKLQERGRLSISDRLSAFFADVPEDKRSITLHHLLTHTAGFPGAIGFDYAPVGRAEFVRQALHTPLAFEPGSSYAYSNVGYGLLAAVVERVSGASYGAFLQESLLQPAGMVRTGYLAPAWPPDSLAHGYTESGSDWGTPLDQPWDEDGPFWHLRGSGGLLTTTTDLWRWHRALSPGGVLTAASLAEMYTPHTREGEGASSFYGYGWVVEDTAAGKRLIWHNGGNPYFSAHMSRFMDDDLVVVVAGNGPRDASAVASKLSRAARGESVPAVRPVHGPGDLPDMPAGRAAAAFAEALAGPEAVRRRFVRDVVAPEILERLSEERLLSMLAMLAQELGGTATITGVAEESPHALRISLSGENGRRVLVDVVVESAAPYRIVDLAVE